MNAFPNEAETLLLRQEAPGAEDRKRLTRAQLNIIYQRRWFLIFVPEELGGAGLSLPEALMLEECLARIDGSLGWTVTLCSGAGWFAGFLNPEINSEVFSDPKACLGGSGAPTGKAILENGGYRISGTWHFATGTPHLTHFTANCIIIEGGKIAENTDGSPRIASFIFKKEEVNPTENWHTMGLKATASHSFTINNLWVPEERCFSIHPAKAQLPHPVYHYPFLSFAEVTLAVNYAGMAFHFLELAGDIFKRKNLNRLLRQKQIALAELNRQRSKFYQTVNASWETALVKEPLNPALQLQISKESQILAEKSLEVCFRLFPYCGMAGADKRSELNRVWRDLFTASQHALLFPEPEKESD